MDKAKLWTKNFLLITLVNFFLYFAFQLFPSTFPPYLKSLGAPDSILGWLQGLLTIAALIVRPFSGFALDKFGRKGIFIVGLGGMILSSAAYGFFPIIGAIFAIRFVHGLAWGVSNTTCGTVATDNIERSHFAEGMGYFSLASSIAMAAAPAVALSLGMGKTIVLSVIFLVVALFLVFQIDYGGQAPTEIKQGEKKSLYEVKSILPSAIMTFMTVTYGAVLSFLALYAAEKSVEGIGLFFTVYAISMLVTRPYLGKLIDQYGYGAGIWPGVVLIPVSLLLLSKSSSLPLFLVCAAFFGIGLGATQSSLQAMAIVSVPQERAGAANATFFTGFDAGLGTGSVLAGLISASLGYGGMFAFIAIFPLIGGVIYFISTKIKPKPAP